MANPNDIVLVGDFVAETSSTVGRDPILKLNGAIKGYAPFFPQINDGPVPYVIFDSNGNKETGIGVLQNNGTEILRQPLGAIVDGVYINICSLFALNPGSNEAQPIDLTGNSRVFSTWSGILANLTAFHVIESLDPDPSLGFGVTAGITGTYEIGGKELVILKGHIQSITQLPI